MPATPYDIAFLKVLMQRSLAEKPAALRCVQLIDERQQKGQPTNARALVVELGMVDQATADQLDALAREDLQRMSAQGVTQSSIGNSGLTQAFNRSATGSGIMAPTSSGIMAPPPPAPLPKATTAYSRAPGPGGTAAVQSGIMSAPTQSGMISASAVRQAASNPAQSALISPATQSGLMRAPPLPAPLPGAPPLPAPLPSPAPLPRATPLPSPAPLPASSPLPAALPKPSPFKATGAMAVPNDDAIGELTMADGSLALTLAGRAGASEDEYYDLAENGQGLEGFESGPKVGRGPVGISYAGRRKVGGGPVVVKVVSRRFDAHPQLLADVLGEVRSWVGLRAPTLAATVALGTSNGRNVVIFDQAKGKSADVALRDMGKPFEPRMAMRAIFDVAQALAAAAERGLHHGDVRASKVFWDGMRGMLADGGLSRASCIAQGFGQLGLTFGHPAYLAPEVLQERLQRPTAQTDVYALGILFYELVCGVLPFQGQGVELLGKHLEAPLPPPPPSVSFSGAVAGLILRMTAKSPSQRLPDARAVVTCITQLLEGKPLSFPAPKQAAGAAKKDPRTISTEDWGLASQRVENKNVSDKWTVSRIEQAPAIGPSDLVDPGSLTSEIGAAGIKASVTGRLPRELVDDAVQAIPGGPKLGEKLGRGAVGTTYDATMQGAPGPVAVKVISKKFAKHPELVKRIIDGVKAAGGFQHPGTVRPLKILQAAGREMVVYEKIAGRTLREALARGPLPAVEATKRVGDLARTLEAARKQGLSHGDLRPEKVLIDDQGRTRLADLGLAEAAALGAGFGAAGVAFGHPTYLAPEVVQERRKDPDEKADIYALGILYYELICGRPPFQAPEPRKTLRMHLEAVIPPPPDGVTIPPPVAELILRMTAKDPARRPASMGDLAQRLAQVGVAAPQPSGEGEVDALDTASEPFTADRSDDVASSDDPVSSQEWGNKSLELSRPSGEWDKNNIIAAPKVGPDEWNPDEDDDDDGPSARPAPAGAAAAARPAPAAAPAAEGIGAALAAVEDKEGAKKSASGRKKRQVALAGPTKGGNPKQLAVAGGGVALVLVVMLVLVFKGDSQPSKPPGVDTDVAVTQPPPPDPGPSEAEKKAAERKALAAKLAQAFDVQARDLLSGQRFKEAVELRNQIPPDLRAEQAVAEKLAAFDEALRTGIERRLEGEVREIEGKLAREEFADARRVVQRVQQWAPAAETWQALEKKVQDAQLQRDDQVAKEQLDGAGPVDAGALRVELEGKLPGAELRTFPNGGVTALLAVNEDGPKSWDKIAGAAPKAESTSDGKPALLVAAARNDQTLLSLRAPFKRLVDATVDLIVKRLGPEGQVAIVQGVRPGQGRGFGVQSGIVPVELPAPREGLKQLASAPLPQLPADGVTVVRLRLITAPARSPTLRELGGLLAISGGEPQRPKAPVTVEARRLEGCVGLFVQDAEVQVIRIEVRGLVDPGK